MTANAIADTAALTGRSLRHITRSLDTIITTTIMPIAFLLLFVFVFGGAIDVGTAQYVDYLLPGILIITIASGGVIHGVPPVPGPQGRHGGAIPVHADRALRGAVGPRVHVARRARDLADVVLARRRRRWASGPTQSCSSGSA